MTIVSRSSPPFGDRGQATAYIGETVNAGFRLQQTDGAGGWTLQSYTDRVFGLRVYSDGGTTLVNVLGVLTSHADGAYIACTIPGTTTDDLTAGLYGWEFAEFVADGRLVITGGTFKVAAASAAAQASGSSGTSTAGSTVYTLRTDLGITTVNYSGAPGAAGSQQVDFSMFVGGALTAGEIVGRFELASAVTLVAARCVATAETASTGTRVFAMTLDGASIGTVTFTASATGVVAITDTTLDAGVLKITAPTPADATLADVSITLSGDR